MARSRAFARRAALPFRIINDSLYMTSERDNHATSAGQDQSPAAPGNGGRAANHQPEDSADLVSRIGSVIRPVRRLRALMAAAAVLVCAWGFLPGVAASASVTPSPRVFGASLVPWFGAVDSVNALEAIHQLKADHGNTLFTSVLAAADHWVTWSLIGSGSTGVIYHRCAATVSRFSLLRSVTAI